MTARLNSTGAPNAFGHHGAVFDRNKQLGPKPYSFNPAGNGRMTATQGTPVGFGTGGTVSVAPMVNGRASVSARNPIGYVAVDAGRPGIAVAGHPRDLPHGPAGHQAAPVPSGVAPPTTLKSYAMRYADDRSLRVGMTDETMRAHASRAVRTSQTNSILQQARNVMHLSSHAQGMGRAFGPNYYIQPLGGIKSASAAKFLENAKKYNEQYEDKLKYHSTVTELKHTEALVSGMVALPDRNPLLAVPRAALVGSNRPVQYNTRYSDSRPEVKSVEQQTMYPHAETWMIQDRAHSSLADKSGFQPVQQLVATGGFHALGRQLPRPTRTAPPSRQIVRAA